MSTIQRTNDPIAMFDRQVPRAFLRDVVRGLAEQVRLSREHCRQEYEKPEFKGILGHHRRAKVEEMLRGVAARHDFKAVAQVNCRRTNSHTHVYIEDVVLTASHVQTPETIVVDAVFRRTCACGNQMLLFEPEERPGPCDALYALLIYGPAETDVTQLGFADIVFPAPDCASYRGRIQLAERYPTEFARQADEDDLSPQSAELERGS